MGTHLLKYLLIQQMFELPGTGDVAEENSEHKSAYVREHTIQDRFMMKRSLEFLFVGI